MRPSVSERATTRDTGLADFMAGLAHDLRSPLGILAEALRDIRGNAALTDEQRLLLTLADRAMARLGGIAETVGLTATLEAGQLEVKREAINLHDVLAKAITSATSIEPRRDVQVTSDLHEGPCRVEGDAERLQRAIAAIVHNALRHARRKVRVACEAVAGGQHRVLVEDDGQGVPEERRATLFRRFLPRATRSGLGLGLSVAHDVIVAHGGEITIEGSSLPPGRPGTTGARFVITLPAHTA